MSYYHTCNYCGANLDPGERCDCMASRRAWAYGLIDPLTLQEREKLLEYLKISTGGDGIQLNRGSDKIAER